MEFREKLQRLARDHNMSVREVQERSGIASHSTLNRWLKGAGEPRISDLARLASVFGVSVGYLADDAIKDPGEPAGGSGLTASEQRMIDLSVELGLDKAAFLLKLASVIGYDEAVSRLTVRPANAVK